MTKWVYDFTEGSRDMRDLRGGKGANVAEMTRVLGADRVSAGFTITTEACVAYMRGGQSEPDGLPGQVADGLRSSSGVPAGGSAIRPIRCSCPCARAREAMPGMLDTVLNLGLNHESVEGLARVTNPRFG